MTYNLSNFSSANNFLDMAVASNQLVDGWMSVMILVLIFVISYSSMKGFESRHAMLSSSLITFVLSAALWGVGLLAERGVVISFVLMLFAIAYSVISE